MKTKQLFFVAAIIFMMTGLNNIQAQRGAGNGYGKGNGLNKNGGQGVCQNIPDLTDEQGEQIKKLKTAHMKEMLVLRNQMGELKAKKRTLSTGDNVDTKVANANIDEITKLQNTIMKKQFKHRQDIRNLLTEDQKVWFDSHQPRRGKGKSGIKAGQGKWSQGPGRGHGRGQR